MAALGERRRRRDDRDDGHASALSRSRRSAERRRAGIADRGRAGRHVVAHDRAGADDRAVADRHAVEDLRAGADPRARRRSRCPPTCRRLLEHRARRGSLKSWSPPIEIRVRGDAACRAPTRTRLAEKISQLKPMFAPSAISMSPFLHERIVLRPMNTPLPIVMPGVRVALRVEQAVVVDDDVVADVDLVRMPQHDVLAEDDVAAAAAEQPRIQRLAQREPERARDGLRDEHDELVLEQRAQPGRPTTSALYFARAPPACAEQLVLRARDVARRRVVRSSLAHGTTPASGRCLRAGRRAGAKPSSCARAADVERAALA